MTATNGIIILNKEAGISSNTAVNKVKKFVGANKAGHLGTLDVLGEGVLPVTINKATRLFDYFLKKDKTYRAVFIFGVETDTLDCEGKITSIDRNTKIDRKDIEKVIENFVGDIQQMPPQFSALKVNGQTAYDLARKGISVDIKPRPVKIYEFKLLDEVSAEKKEELKHRFVSYNDIDLQPLLKNIFEFEITCSAGTYIRSLCRDLANALATCGTMLCIIRTRCGAFNIDGAKSLRDVENGDFDVIDVQDVIDLPIVKLSKEQGKDLLDGKKVEFNNEHEFEFKLYCGDEFFGIANNRNGVVKVTTYLR